MPTLDGLILTEWNAQIAAKVSAFAQERGWTHFLLRHDKSPEMPPYPMGGYLVSVENVDREVRWYLQRDRIVLLLAPCDPLDDLYSISTMFESKTSIILEIVGPGFDASDLQRGNLSPHETITLDLQKLATSAAHEPVSRLITSHRIIDAEDYRATINLRINKIFKKFVLGEKQITHLETEVSDEVDHQVKHMLVEGGHTLLLQHADAYRALDTDRLATLVRHALRFRDRYGACSPLEFPCVLASSFVNKGADLIFWDVVLPSTKYRSRSQ